ncbi:MAG: hypothetical protein GY701_21695, partial [Sulfitobacter sp.]|nr:hypothetical protein [Sulfitobacter sp.]
MTSSTSDKNSQFDSPVLEEASVDSFSFIQSNGIGGSDTETVTVDLSAANRAPTFGEGELVLWNRLGSETEVLNSEVGPGVQLTSYKIDDWQEARIAPAKFGNGLFVNHDTREGWANDGGNFFAVDLAATTLTSERGTIEHWFEFEYDSSMRNHTYFIATSDVLASHYANKNIHADFQFSAGWNGWDYGSYGKRFFLDMAGATAFTPDYSAGPGGELEFNDGTTMHFAFVWDVAGIDGTADTLRIYVDGEEKADAQANWSTTGAMDRYLFIGSRPNYGRWDHHYNAVKGVTDNLVIWNEARTDFSDRFVEAPSTPGLGPYTVEENTLDGTIVGTVAANDADGDTLTYTLTAGNTDPDGDGNPAFAINPTTGTITVNDSGDLDYESTTGFDLEVSATDPGGLSDTATVTIALTNLAEPGNDRPEAQDAAFTLPENSPASTDVGSVMAADLDAGDTLTYAITEGNDDPDGDGQAAFAIDAANGAITINDSGDLDFETTPAYNLSVTVTDLGGLSDSAAVTVSLGDANDPPIPTDDGGTGYQTDEDSGFVTGNVLSNDTDQDGNTLSITDLDTSTTQGRVTDNGDGTFAYDPNGMFDYLHQGEQASDHFTYAIGDGHGGTDTATVTVAIDGVDHAPRIAGGGEGGLVLWNRLGSEAEVLNSEVGPDLEFYSH